MKKRQFLAMLAAAALTTGFSSCSNDENGIDGPKGENARLVINIQSPATKATGATPAADATISNYTVFVFDKRGTLEERKTGTAASIILNESVTTNASSVYVVANAGDITTTIPATITSKSALEAWIGDLNGNASQLTSRWATGTNADPISFTNKEATANVVMKFISARITVKVIPMDDYTNAPANPKSLILQSVSVLNAGGASKLYSSLLMPTAAELSAASFAGKPYYAGLDMTGMEYVPASYTGGLSYLTDAVNTLDKADFTGKNFYYYSFENNADAPSKFPTIVTLKGTYDGQAIYHAIHLAAYMPFTTGSVATSGVERGKSYDITINLTGKASFDDGGDYPGDTGGEDDPTIDPKDKGKLTVSLSITDWNPVVLSKDF